MDISTGSVGLGVAMTAFAALMQDYLDAHEWLVPAERRGHQVQPLGVERFGQSGSLPDLYSATSRLLRRSDFRPRLPGALDISQ